MTAQGEDILAWLDRAISEREATAREADTGEWSAIDTGYEEWEATVGSSSYNGGAIANCHMEEARHIALHAPVSVLRRCAADRKLLTLHNTPGNVFPDAPYMDDNRWCVGCGYGNDGEPLTPHVNDCPTLHALALGYGWTESER